MYTHARLVCMGGSSWPFTISYCDMPGMYGTHGWVIMAFIISYCDMPGMYGTHGWIIMTLSYCDMPGMYGTHAWVIMEIYNNLFSK